MGDKTIPDEAPPNRFIPHESQVSIYHNQGVVHSLSRSLAHCDVIKKLSHAYAGINRSQTPGACLVHPGVRDNTILRSSYLHNGGSYTGKMIYLYRIMARSVDT